MGRLPRGVRVPQFAPLDVLPSRGSRIDLPSAADEEPFRLTFLLPRAMTLGVATGRYGPTLHQCRLDIERHRNRDYLVRVQGPSREKVFDQARRYLRLAARGHIAAGAAFHIDAVMVTPARVCSGRDNWTIIVGADVAFSPTSIPPDLPEPDAPVTTP